MSSWDFLSSRRCRVLGYSECWHFWVPLDGLTELHSQKRNQHLCPQWHTQRRHSTFHLIDCESQVSRRPSLIWIFLLAGSFFSRRRQCLFKWHRRCFEGFDLGFWLFALGSPNLSNTRGSSETQTNWRWDCSSGFVGRVPNQLESDALTRWICHPQSTNIYIFLVGPLCSLLSFFESINFTWILDLFFGRKKNC